jgi:uncharacterized protein (TIGR03000 family)
MNLHRLTRGGAAALTAGLLLAAVPATPAQPTLDSVKSNPSYTAAGPVSAGPLAGYSGAYGTPRMVSSYGYPYTFGRYYYGPSTIQSYSPVIEAPSSVFMTSINYPGQYGSITMGVPAYRYIARPDGMNYYGVPSSVLESPRDVDITAVRPVATQTAPAGETATVNVLVPSDATVWLQGQEMSETGSYRQFVSPPLTAGQRYRYQVQASWRENGRDVTQTRSVPIRAGQRVDVDFTQPQPAPERTSTLRARPLPP